MKPPPEFIDQFTGADRGIQDPDVLHAMMEVERDRFVSPDMVEYAYADKPLPIGEDQTISQPYIVAYMIEKLELDPGDRVLEVGAGCGYEATVLAALGTEVYAIERIPELADLARVNLAAAGYPEVNVRTGDGSKGWSEHAPFDGIIVACAAFGDVPPALLEQLAEGGRLILPLDRGGHQQLLLIERRGEEFQSRSLIPVRFVPLVEDE
jgi:protein-L-isoaspartate(D-aspartate) O-methyltransferase